MAEWSKALTFLSWTGVVWVWIPPETYIFILNFSFPPRSEQVNGAVANEIKHVHSPEVIVVLDPRYNYSYTALYIHTCSIALFWLWSCLIFLLQSTVVAKTWIDYGIYETSCLFYIPEPLEIHFRSYIYFLHYICKEIVFICLYDNLNIATPFPKTIKPRYFISNMPFWYLIYIQQT